MYFLLPVLFFLACTTVTKSPYEAVVAPSFPFEKKPVSELRGLPRVAVLAEGNTALSITLKPPRGRKLAGTVRFRVTETSGPIGFRGNDRKFALPKPRKTFSVPFNVKEGQAGVRFVVEWYHCPAAAMEGCAQESGYYGLRLDAAKGRGLTYVPVLVTP